MELFAEVESKLKDARLKLIAERAKLDDDIRRIDHMLAAAKARPVIDGSTPVFLIDGVKKVAAGLGTFTKQEIAASLRANYPRLKFTFKSLDKPIAKLNSQHIFA